MGRTRSSGGEPERRKPAKHPAKAKTLVKVLGGHDVRLRILRLLMDSDKPVSPKEAAEELSWPLSNVAYHFRVLAKYEILKLVRTAPVRGSTQHFYRPNPVVVKMPMVQQILAATAGDQ